MVDDLIPLLFEKNARSFNTFGMGFLPKWIKGTPEVIEERNGEYYFQGELPISGLNVDKLAIDRIICCAPAPGKRIQPFRIQDLSKPPDSDTLKVYAPHVSYQLTQTAVRPNSGNNPPTYATAQAAMNALWNACRPSMNGVFTPYSDIVPSASLPFGNANPLSVRAALGGVDGSMIDVFGGELEWDGWTVRLLSSRGSVTNKIVRYGANLETLEFETDARPMITAYIGYVKDEADGVTLMGNIVYLPGADAFAYPRMAMIDFTEQFKDSPTLPTAQQITDLTQAAVNGLTASLPTFVNITAVPDSLQDVYLCDTVNVVHPGYDFQQSAKIVRTVFDPITERYKQVTVGEMAKLITDTIAEISGKKMQKHQVSGRAYQ